MANFGGDLNAVPYWYVLRKGLMVLCKPPQCSVAMERPHYHQGTCTWTSGLRVAHKEETYYCGSGHMWANHTTESQGMYTVRTSLLA